MSIEDELAGETITPEVMGTEPQIPTMADDLDSFFYGEREELPLLSSEQDFSEALGRLNTFNSSTLNASSLLRFNLARSTYRVFPEVQDDTRKKLQRRQRANLTIGLLDEYQNAIDDPLQQAIKTWPLFLATDVKVLRTFDEYLKAQRTREIVSSSPNNQYYRLKAALLDAVIESYLRGDTQIDVKHAIEQSQLIHPSNTAQNQSQSFSPSLDAEPVAAQEPETEKPKPHADGYRFLTHLALKKSSEAALRRLPTVANLEAFNAFTEEYARVAGRDPNDLTILGDSLVEFNGTEIRLSKSEVRAITMLLKSYGHPPFTIEDSSKYGFYASQNSDEWMASDLNRVLAGFKTWGLITYNPEKRGGILLLPVHLKDARR